MIRLRYGYDIFASQRINEIGKISPRPIYLAHCVQDKIIPLAHMDKLLTVAKNTQTWRIPVCEHAYGYKIVPAENNQKAIQFFDESLK